MAKEKQQKPQGGGQVVSMHCLCEDCKEKPKRGGFCDEHFFWFKEGLITKAGMRAKDFDKKYQHYLRRQKQAA